MVELENYKKYEQELIDNHCYQREMEHDACGVGLVCEISRPASRRVVDYGLEALKNIWHRGAVDADGKTGDGAGIMLELPQGFFSKVMAQSGLKLATGRLAIGMVFLPRTEFDKQEASRTIVEREIARRGFELLGWRQVPVDLSALGKKALHTRPEIEQVLISCPSGLKTATIERELYLIRKSIEKRVLGQNIEEFYICSLSSQSIIYKGMFVAEQLATFYPDLKDESFCSRYAIYHQRYSTNTFPRWSLAQPFRKLAHNGEINTLKGNLNWLKVQEEKMSHESFGDEAELIKPVVSLRSSDSAALDNVFELLVQAEKSAPLAKSILIPEAWRKNSAISPELAAFYSYCNAQMKPWDGPAAIAACHDQWIIAGLDRSGLRPMRYLSTNDDLLIVGSEAGMVEIPQPEIRDKGRLGPGQMIGVDLEQKKFFTSDQLKGHLAKSAPYHDFIRSFTPFEDLKSPVLQNPQRDLYRDMRLFGYTREALLSNVRQIAETGKEPIGSMGDDASLAVFSPHYRGLHHFFRQNFAQVTNPALDSLRESNVMSLTTRLGNLVNVLNTDNLKEEVIVLNSPILSNNGIATLKHHLGANKSEISFLFDWKNESLNDAVERIQQQALELVLSGASHIFLSDEGADYHQLPVPPVLAVGAIHSYLIAKGLRSKVSLHVQSGECCDTHHVAVLIGVGATTVNPYLVEEIIRNDFAEGLIDVDSEEQAARNLRRALEAGLLKIMSKIGVSMVSSYRGGYQFEVMGLSRTVVDRFFPGIMTKLSGLEIKDIERRLIDHAQRCQRFPRLPVGGLYKYRSKGEQHSLEGPAIHTLQTAVERGSYTQYLRYVKLLEHQEPVFLRDLLEVVSPHESIGTDEVETITSIRRRFISPGMSHGALSSEAHETLAIAMNRMGARSVSGEGGEDPERFHPRPNGDNANSAIKQVASGRFGVTAEYLNSCDEIEIKLAQGAKPGEGGQLPGFKVTAEIARLRHSTEGVMLISPPPHHDIYSIEDLAQLIYDLKRINPRAKICVKLVAKTGIGTIAAGVAKANADVILIAGHSGGTGASAQSSICHAGMPWEMGLAEVHQVLIMNNLRDKVCLRVDGGIKTGRDIIIGALLGAEEFGIGTAALVAMGCLLVRQCQANVCPVGICTQDESLRAKFAGTPEKVINLFSFIAEDVHHQLAEMGISNLNDIIGRTDLLRRKILANKGAGRLDLNPLFLKLGSFQAPKDRRLVRETQESLDELIIPDAAPFFEQGEKMELTYQIRNTHRSVGTRLSHHVVRKNMKFLAEDHLTIKLRGSAGQSLGAFGVQGLKLIVYGDANDYVGKGLSGAEIVVRPFASASFVSHENAIIGNTVLYGATSGRLFASGQAGERFAVRNSGADTVIEGCGSNGCEYMTGGNVVVLGDIGSNFAAGMTGGMAFLYDPKNRVKDQINLDSVQLGRIQSEFWNEKCRSLIEQHYDKTGSALANDILENWQQRAKSFWQVCPQEMLERLEYPLEWVSPQSMTID